MQILKQVPFMMVKDQRKSLADYRTMLSKSLKNRINQEHQRILSFHKMIEMVHPKQTLKRGFSITRSRDGKILKSVRHLKTKDDMITQLADGNVESEVKIVAINKDV